MLGLSLLVFTHFPNIPSFHYSLFQDLCTTVLQSLQILLGIFHELLSVFIRVHPRPITHFVFKYFVNIKSEFICVHLCPIRIFWLRLCRAKFMWAHKKILSPAKSSSPPSSPTAPGTYLYSRAEFPPQEAAHGLIGLARHPGDHPDPIIRENLRRIPVDPPANESLHSEFPQFLKPLKPIPVLERKLLAPYNPSGLQVEEKEAGGVIEPGRNPRPEYGDGHFHGNLKELKKQRMCQEAPPASDGET
jgi:hypothetical protein